MPTEKKVQAVQEMKELLSDTTIVISANYTGLPVDEMTKLRHALREKGVAFKVVKNTLTYRAADELEQPGIREIVQGPTGLATGQTEPTEIAKALSDFIKDNRSPLQIIGAVLDDQVLSASDVEQLTTLPSREVLLAQLLGQMNTPIGGLVNVLNSPLSGLATVLNGPIAGLTRVLGGRAQQLQQ